jgi:hypothetical protein
MFKKALISLEEKPVSIGWVILGSLFAFYPLLRYWDDMALFFYQGDEWTQLHEMDLHGYWTWVFMFFGENFMPVFKLVWSGLLFAGHGNYQVFLVFSFLLHSLVVFLFGFLLRQWGFGWITIVFSQLVLALNHVHIEILSQSIQFSNLLAYAFLLLLVMAVSSLYLDAKKLSPSRSMVICLLSLLGALSFSRGLLNGVVVSAGLLIGWLYNGRQNKQLLSAAILVLAPSLLAGVITAYVTARNGSGIDSFTRLDTVAAHFYDQLSINPWLQQFRDYPFDTGLAARFLLLNLFSIGFGIICARRMQRPLLLVLVLLFLGNAILLAWGRSHQPLATVASWRYQYGVLIVFAPLVGIFLERMIRMVPVVYIRVAIGVFMLIWVSMRVSNHWQYHAPSWSKSRGSDIRENVTNASMDPGAFTVSQFEGIDNSRAMELVKKYNLH